MKLFSYLLLFYALSIDYLSSYLDNDVQSSWNKFVENSKDSSNYQAYLKQSEKLATIFDKRLSDALESKKSFAGQPEGPFFDEQRAKDEYLLDKQIEWLKTSKNFLGAQRKYAEALQSGNNVDQALERYKSAALDHVDVIKKTLDRSERFDSGYQVDSDAYTIFDKYIPVSIDEQNSDNTGKEKGYNSSSIFQLFNNQIQEAKRLGVDDFKSGVDWNLVASAKDDLRSNDSLKKILNNLDSMDFELQNTSEKQRFNPKTPNLQNKLSFESIKENVFKEIDKIAVQTKDKDLQSKLNFLKSSYELRTAEVRMSDDLEAIVAQKIGAQKKSVLDSDTNRHYTYSEINAIKDSFKKNNNEFQKIIQNNQPQKAQNKAETKTKIIEWTPELEKSLPPLPVDANPNPDNPWVVNKSDAEKIKNEGKQKEEASKSVKQEEVLSIDDQLEAAREKLKELDSKGDDSAYRKQSEVVLDLLKKSSEESSRKIDEAKSRQKNVADYVSNGTYGPKNDDELYDARWDEKWFTSKKDLVDSELEVINTKKNISSPEARAKVDQEAYKNNLSNHVYLINQIMDNNERYLQRKPDANGNLIQVGYLPSPTDREAYTYFNAQRDSAKGLGLDLFKRSIDLKQTAILESDIEERIKKDAPKESEIFYEPLSEKYKNLMMNKKIIDDTIERERLNKKQNLTDEEKLWLRKTPEYKNADYQKAQKNLNQEFDEINEELDSYKTQRKYSDSMEQVQNGLNLLKASYDLDQVERLMAGYYESLSGQRAFGYGMYIVPPYSYEDIGAKRDVVKTTQEAFSRAGSLGKLLLSPNDSVSSRPSINPGRIRPNKKKTTDPESMPLQKNEVKPIVRSTDNPDSPWFVHDQDERSNRAAQDDAETDELLRLMAAENQDSLRVANDQDVQPGRIRPSKQRMIDPESMPLQKNELTTFVRSTDNPDSPWFVNSPVFQPGRIRPNPEKNRSPEKTQLPERGLKRSDSFEKKRQPNKLPAIK